MLKSWICVCLFGLTAGMGTFNPVVKRPIWEYGGIIYNGKTAVCQAVIVDVAAKRVTAVKAAHCVRGSSNLSVLLAGKEKIIGHVMIHPFYKPPLRDYDIAVLTIKKERTEEFKEMSLSVEEPRITGGLNLIQITADQKLVEDIATKEERQACQSKYGSKILISTKMICAQSKSNVLGGSALYFKILPQSTNHTDQYVLAGVASYSLNSSLPTIFTNIANSEIHKFIDRNI